MIFNNLKIQKSYEILLEPITDDRGFFSRVYCYKQMNDHEMSDGIKQVNNSYNKKKGTIRGFHYQINGYEEGKFLRAINGSFLNVSIDLRKKSKTYLAVQYLKICSTKRNMVYVPKGCANAIQILEDETELIYFSTQYYSPENEKGIKFNDKYFNIEWPLPFTESSLKDRSWPDFDDSI